MWLGRYDGAFGKIVAFDCAAACGDEPGLVGLDRFDAVSGGDGMLVIVGTGERRRDGNQRREKKWG